MTNLLWILILAPLPGWAVQTPLNLQAAVKYALEHSPTVQSAQQRYQVEQLTENNAFSKFLPSLDFTTTNGLERTRGPSSTDPFKSSLGLTLTENLYDNGESLTRYKGAQASKERAQVQFLKTRDQVCLEVAREFYNYSLSSKLLNVRTEQLKILEKQMASVEGQFRQGIKTKKDYLRLKSQVQKARISLEEAQNTIEKSSMLLHKLLGAPIEQKEPLIFAAVDPQISPASIPKQILKTEKNYVSQVARISEKINALEVDLVKRRYWPQINFTASAFYLNANYLGGGGAWILGNETHGWNALVTLNYNIFDWGIKRREIEIAESRRMIQDNENRAAVLEVHFETSKLMNDLKVLEEQYKLQKDLLQSEQESYDLVLADYRSGRIPYIDMIMNLNDLLDAKVNFLGVYYQLVTQIAVYHFHEGTLYDKVLAP